VLVSVRRRAGRTAGTVEQQKKKQEALYRARKKKEEQWRKEGFFHVKKESFWMEFNCQQQSK